MIRRIKMGANGLYIMYTAGAGQIADDDETCHMITLISLCVLIIDYFCRYAHIRHLSPHFFHISPHFLPSATMPVQWKSQKKYNYSDAMLNTQIPCPTCGKSFRRQGFKKHEASCKARGEAEKDRAQAGRRYEQTLDGEY